MVTLPVLIKGPFSLDLDKSVRYITYIFKGISCGVVVSTIIASILLEINLMADSTTDEQASSINRQLLLTICICAFALAYFFLCSYLYKGVEERNRTWIFPWFLVTTVIGFSLIIVFFASFMNGFGVIHLILPIVIVFVFYCDLVVYSLYIELGTSFVSETPPTQVVPS